MRPSCYFCARKHLGRANIKLEEAQLGYPEHLDLALAELSEAESELLAERPDLARIVRHHRKELESSLAGDPTGAGYRVPIMDLLKLCRPDQAIKPASIIAKPNPPPVAAPVLIDSPIPAAQPEAAVAPTKKGCSPCEEGAKFKQASNKWGVARASGTMERLVAIIAPLSDFNPAYSLVTVILDQVRALALLPKTNVVLLVRSQANCDLLPPLPDNVDVLTSIPHIAAGEDQPLDQPVKAASAWLTGVVASLGKAYVFTHDLVFQSWFSHWAKALHELPPVDGISFYHWMHSSVGTRPTKPEAQWRTSVPTGHTMVALNSSDLPYLMRYYQAEEKSFVSVPNPRDVRVFYGMPATAAELVTKHQLHTADIFQLYPLSATRMQAKGVTKVIDVFNALCRVQEGIVCRLLIADAHANGSEGRTNRDLMVKYAKNVGLPDGVLSFVSDSLPACGTHGLDAAAIRSLFTLANIFVFPTTSEAGSLVLMEAALAGNLLILNESLPCLSNYISSTGAIWVPFGSAKESAGAWNPTQLAGRIHAELAQNKANASKRAIMREHSLEAYGELLMERIFASDERDIPLRTAQYLPKPIPAEVIP